MMSEETNDFKPLADADDATSQQPVTPAADYPATGAVAGTAATNNSATGNAADRATDEPAKPAKSSKPSISMSDLPDLRATFDPNAPLDDSSDRSRDEFTTVYDIIDSIEEELDEAKTVDNCITKSDSSDGPVRIERSSVYSVPRVAGSP